MQSSEPLIWFQVLAPTVVAIAAAGIAGYIAWRQWKTGDDRLRLDMFEKRFAVYDATRTLLVTVTRHGQITSEDLSRFYQGILGAEFLFDGDARAFLTQIAAMAFKAMSARSRADRQSQGRSIIRRGGGHFGFPPSTAG
jgi:hypothetical protein